MHLITAFIVVFAIRWLSGYSVPDRILVYSSFWTLIPDIVDKLWTGTRFPLHSYVILVPIVITVNILAYRYSSHSSTTYSMILFGSISLLLHPLMDLEGLIPLFFPIILDGYQLDFVLTIVQGFPPQISEFSFDLITGPFDYTGTYNHEGTLLSTNDFFLLILISGVIVYSFFYKLYLRNRSRCLKLTQLGHDS